MITKETLALDSADMYGVIKDFPKQIENAFNKLDEAPGFEIELPDHIVILGMGGSAIGGELLKNFLECVEGADNLHIEVCRDYSSPRYLTDKSCVIASSYSGETEETLSAVKEALTMTNNVIAITTGGSLAELGSTAGFPVVKLPAGFQPRAALPYSFFTMLSVALNSAFISSEARANIIADWKAAIKHIFAKSEALSNIEGNPALSLAKLAQGKIPVIYSPAKRLAAVNLRWRGQIHENAKNLAFGSFLPEMNHNEINSWSNPLNTLEDHLLITLYDVEDHPRIKLRQQALETLIGSSASRSVALSGEGGSLLERLFDLIYLGDWFSFYLALLNGVDPTPIPLISKLKDIMAKG